MTPPTLALNDGRSIPQLGFGTYLIPDDAAEGAVREAIIAGYRSIDTAAIYGNEAGVGRGIRAAGVAREDLFVTTKLWNDRQSHDDALKACDESLAKLGLDHVDLYLIHWPSPRRGTYVSAWKALVELQKRGKAKSIGVSNFTQEHLERVIGETGVVPAVNQIELHPHFQQRALRAFHAKHGIVTESWSPLGQGRLTGDPAIMALAAQYGKTAAQLILRWHLDNGLVAIPKSTTTTRIWKNFNVFDFHLKARDLDHMNSLDRADGRIGPDPETAAF